MKRIAIALLLIACAACTGPRSGMISEPGRGAVSISVVPNPILATRATGDTYNFPFDVVVRETGGRPVNIQRVTATVFAPGGITLGRETWEADRIRSMGFNTTVAANGELRYHFAPQRSVPDDRIFGSLSAELRVEGADDSGSSTSASTVVTVRR